MRLITTDQPLSNSWCASSTPMCSFAIVELHSSPRSSTTRLTNFQSEPWRRWPEPPSAVYAETFDDKTASTLARSNTLEKNPALCFCTYMGSCSRCSEWKVGSRTGASIDATSGVEALARLSAAAEA